MAAPEAATMGIGSDQENEKPAPEAAGSLKLLWDKQAALGTHRCEISGDLDAKQVERTFLTRPDVSNKPAFFEWRRWRVGATGSLCHCWLIPARQFLAQNE
jgi:hypothetical protein